MSIKPSDQWTFKTCRMSTFLKLFLVLMTVDLALSKVEVDSVKLVNNVNTLPVDKGANLTLTCRSDLASLTLEFGAVVYNDTKNENGTYTVTYNKTAEKGDNNQTVLCKATNSTGFKFEASATVLLKVSTNASFSGIGELEEGNNAVTCIITSTLYPPSHVLLRYFSLRVSDPIVDGILKNTSLYKTSEVYDSKSDSYTTTVTTAHIPVTRRLNDQFFLCSGVVNNFQFIKVDKIIVLYGPNNGSLTLDWSMTGGMVEGTTVALRCTLSASNPASKLIWQNDTAQFSPPTPAVITKPWGTNYQTEQTWTFPYRREQSGSNITCMAIGHNNITESKTLQIGDIKYPPDLVTSGKTLVDEGDTLNLTCKVVAANPSATGFWKGRGSGHLVITNIKKDQNQQEYTCTATNSAGTSNQNIRLSVQYGPDFEIDSNVFGTEGNNLTLSPKVSGNPIPSKFTWRKLGSNTVLSTSKNLVLRQISKGDEGFYVLEATSARVRENNTTEEVTRNVSVFARIGYAPKDIQLSPNITLTHLDAGSPVPVVNCSVDCFPRCDFSWTRHYRNTTTPISSNSLLVLGNATGRMPGIYVCEGYNLLNGKKQAASASFELRVNYAPEVYTIEINGFSKGGFNETDNITVTAVIRSYPLLSNVSFGTSNDKSRRSTMILDSRYSFRPSSQQCSYDCESKWDLTLFNASCTDTGIRFIVQAKSSLGYSAIHATPKTLYVTCSPRLPDGYVVKRSYAVCEGEVLNMSMTVVSVPGPLIVWSKKPIINQQVLLQNPSGSNVSVIYNSRYTIPIVGRQTFGNYEFEARNAVGGPIRFPIQVVRGPNCKEISTVLPDSSTSKALNVASTRTSCSGVMCLLEFALFITIVLLCP